MSPFESRIRLISGTVFFVLSCIVSLNRNNTTNKSPEKSGKSK